MSERLGDGPIDPQYHELMDKLAHVIDFMFNGVDEGRSVGFVLMVFPLDQHDGRTNYISNADRDDVVLMMKEQIKRFEGQPEVVGHG